MTVLKCKMCGGDLTLYPGRSVCECEFCGTSQTVPIDNSEKKITMFERANRLRCSQNFDSASIVYECIVSEFPEDPEAYWGLILCEYGIEYVDDKTSGKKIPTCHKTSYKSIFDNPNYKSAMDKSDPIARRMHIDEAKRIEKLREEILALSAQEKPYDVFICYKDLADNGERTAESVVAQEVYNELTRDGYRVFFARVTLADKLGTNYEPYIFSALQTSKVMLVFASNPINVNSSWVKNEWQRYLELIDAGENKTLIPCVKDMSVGDLPEKLSCFQAQDMGKIGAMQEIQESIRRLIKKNPTIIGDSVYSSDSSAALTERGDISLEDEDFDKALNFYERALDANPKDAKAYLGLFLAERRVTSLEKLSDIAIDYKSDKHFKRAMQFADARLSERLRQALTINERNEAKVAIGVLVILLNEIAEKRQQEYELEQKRLEQEKRSAAEKAYSEACSLFESIVEQEAEPQIKDVASNYEEHLTRIRTEKGEEQLQLLQKKTELHMQITALQKREGALGFFDKTEKKYLMQKIESMQLQYQQIVDQEADLTSAIQERISNIEQERDVKIAAIKSQIRSKYPSPKIEDYQIQ